MGEVTLLPDQNSVTPEETLYRRICYLAGAAALLGGAATIFVTLRGAFDLVLLGTGALALAAGISVIVATHAISKIGLVKVRQLAEITSAASQIQTTAAELQRSQEAHLKLALQIEQLERASELQKEQIRQFEEKRLQRSITSQQKFDIRHALSSLKGSQVEIRLYGQDAEARSFAGIVRDTLQMAGLEVNLRVMTGKTGTGFALVVQDKKNVPQLAKAILGAFSKSGVKLGFVEEHSVSAGTFFIFLGEKKKLT